MSFPMTGESAATNIREQCTLRSPRA